MRFPIFIVAAVVLTVFAIIATAQTTGADAGQLFGVSYISWFIAGFLSFLVDLLVGGWGYASGAWGRRQDQRQP
jgi:hypothetical protein